MGIPLITLRLRSRKLLEQVYGLPPSAWHTIELDVHTRKYRTPRVYEQTIAMVGGQFRQMFIQDLGHYEPTILLTNQGHTPAKALLNRYAQRMLIENAVSDEVRFFDIDALSSAVGLKVDFDLALLVLASGLYRLVARRMRGYGDAHDRRMLDVPSPESGGQCSCTPEGCQNAVEVISGQAKLPAFEQPFWHPSGCGWVFQRLAGGIAGAQPPTNS